MTIQKFKSFEEAERANWNFNPDEKYYKQGASFYRLIFKLSKFSYPAGVFKFKSFEEAEAHKMNVIIKSALKELKK